MRQRIVWCVLVTLALGVAGQVLARQSEDDKALKEDLKKLQGKWEYTFDAGDLKGLRKVKEIKGNTERVSWYTPDGKLFCVNKVEFKLQKQGDDRVFSWFNGTVTEGEGKGTAFADGSFVYRLEGDRWIESGSDGQAREWKRVKDGDKK